MQSALNIVSYLKLGHSVLFYAYGTAPITTPAQFIGLAKLQELTLCKLKTPSICVIPAAYKT